MWVWISGRRWTFGIREQHWLVVECAPISRWALGKDILDVVEWWRAKGADKVICLR